MKKSDFVYNPQSRVEATALQHSGLKLTYAPVEKIGVVEVENFPQLGKLTALRFIEWVQLNPGGVVSLPTGKSPEHFIRWVTHYLRNWHLKSTQQQLESQEIDPGIRPDVGSLRFVQIDEFYPINPAQHNSFHYYINKFYIKDFGLDPNKALLIDAWNLPSPEGRTPQEIFINDVVDLTLRHRMGKIKSERMQKELIERVDEFCTDYETRIREMGGIGFFLGGIGPDGHIGFNVRGSSPYSTTRLTATNYETQAAAASDLGGIEVARRRLVITIGLSTITYNPDAVAIIIAAGEAKAKVVRDAVENPVSNRYPASVLQQLPHARFYLTKGAASKLTERHFTRLQQKEALSDLDVEYEIIELALKTRKKLCELTKSDLKADKCANLVLQKNKSNPDEICKIVHDGILAKLDKGLDLIENKVFIHTAPHHDDIILGYWAYIVHLVRSPLNAHYFTYLTSGFNAVTNNYVRRLLENLMRHIDSPLFHQLMAQNYFDPNNQEGRNRDIYKYLDAVAAHSNSAQREAEACRLLRNLIFLFEENSIPQLKNRVHELLMYFKTQYPGKKDLPYIQQLKGMIREWESDLKWGYLGFNSDNVHHLRLGFYKGDIFTEEPKVERDVMPVLHHFQALRPDIVTVALDPEGSGPDTHYKVLQIISEALRRYEEETGRHDIEVWGYRNVWFRFHPSEATTFVPVSLNSMAVLENAFDKCFGSQREASFPSYELDGPFSRLSRSIMVEQFNQITTCIGREYFDRNPHPRVRACHGILYVKKMSLQEFYTRSYELRRYAESAENKDNL